MKRKIVAFTLVLALLAGALSANMAQSPAICAEDTPSSVEDYDFNGNGRSDFEEAIAALNDCLVYGTIDEELARAVIDAYLLGAESVSREEPRIESVSPEVQRRGQTVTITGERFGWNEIQQSMAPAGRSVGIREPIHAGEGEFVPIEPETYGMPVESWDNHMIEVTVPMDIPVEGQRGTGVSSETYSIQIYDRGTPVGNSASFTFLFGLQYYHEELPEYLGNCPRNIDRNWTEKLQGVTHDDEHWFFTRKTPENAILKFHVTTDLNADWDDAVAEAPRPNELDELDYWHFGDPDHFYWNGVGYLFVPVEGRDKDAILAVFRNDDDLTFIGYTTLDSQTDKAGWCAINPVDNLLYSSHNEIKGSLPVYRYTVNFTALENDIVQITPHSNFTLWEESGGSLLPIHVKKYIQGGTFSPDGWLYLANGYDCPDEDGGIHVFDPDGILRYHSSLTKGATFEYRFDKDFPLWQEPEGLTFWDLDELRVPLDIPYEWGRGQLHAILINWHNNLWFKHYRIE